MPPCYNCNGVGTVTCSNCQGKGGIWYTLAGNTEFRACEICAGRRNVKCPVCGGTAPPGPPVNFQIPLAKWWSGLSDRNKKAISWGLAILVIIYLMNLLM